MEHTIQRRNLLVAAAGLWGVARISDVWAQDATPQASPIPRAGHPAAGLWEWSTNLTDDPYPTPMIMANDGTCLEYDNVSGVGIGFWQPINDREALLTVQYQTLAGPWLDIFGPVDLFKPDHVPAPNTFGNVILVSRSIVSVAVKEGTIVLHGTFQAWSGYARMGLDFEGPASRRGKRLST